MKRLVYPIIIIVMASLIVINYYAYRSPKIKKIISQNKVYTILNDQQLYIKLYSNYNSPFHNKEAIDSVYLEDKNKENRWLLETISISKEKSLDYLKETYNSYLFNFKLPILTTNVEMN